MSRRTFGVDVQHPGQADVIDEAGLATEKLRVFDPLHIDAEGTLAHAGSLSARRRLAASSAAATMLL